MLPLLRRLYLAHVFIIAVVANANLEARDDCPDNYSKCNPKGVSSSADTPAVGADLSPLYIDILTSVNGAKAKRDSLEARDELATLLETRASTSGLCCNDGTLCLLLQGLNLPFCYDNYTTNYFLPGGATGQIVSGEFNSTGGQANLISGDYTLTDGTTGNVYGSEDSPERPNTSTLPIPTQYTAAGSGSAIPATALGQVITVTTTFPGTTIEPTTIAPTIVEASTVAVSGSASILPASTIAGSTIPGTTVPARTSTYTTTAAAGTSTAKGAAVAKHPAISGAAGLGFLIFAIFGL